MMILYLLCLPYCRILISLPPFFFRLLGSWVQVSSGVALSFFSFLPHPLTVSSLTPLTHRPRLRTIKQRRLESQKHHYTKNIHRK
ncbi:hypothetical protein F5H01DRAFT_333885 [Linnemannia elongata]|nr:hypothetical protein F5H01DRAFT_333885 [Linnemannia elongata]